MIMSEKMNSQSVLKTPFAFEKEKLEALDTKNGKVLELSVDELRDELSSYLRGKKSKRWKSINTNKGKLRNPELHADGRVTAQSDHSEIEILQAIVFIERWSCARRSAGARRAAQTRRRHKEFVQAPETRRRLERFRELIEARRQRELRSLCPDK
jgi:hypothetical protein